ncbi:MAG: hypothetical protein ACOC1O_05845 [bacterium]
MRKISKIIIVVLLLLIIIRISNPIRKIEGPSNMVFEYDPLFTSSSQSKSSWASTFQETALQAGETSVANIYHIFILIIISSGVILLLEKRKND